MDFLQVNGETHDEAPGERTARARTTAWILWIQEKPGLRRVFPSFL